GESSSPVDRSRWPTADRPPRRRQCSRRGWPCSASVTGWRRWRGRSGAGGPVLGICYGMQTMAQQLGGRVTPSGHREFGYAQVTVTAHCRLLEGLRDHDDPQGRAVLDVWMSHGDRVDALPPGFVPVGASTNAPFAAMADESRCFYAVQFHPEVTHTLQGARIIERFVREICG